MKIYRLTPEQQRLWFEWKKDPTNLTYNTTFQLKMEGRLDIELLKQAIIFTKSKLDVYRTYFIEQDGNVQQVILSPEETNARYGKLPDFELIDLTVTSETPENIKRQAEKLAYEKCNRQYNLLQYPIEHHILIKYGEEQYLFGLTAHHILSDAHSAMFVFQILSNYYNHSWLTALAIWGYKKIRHIPDMGKYLEYIEKEYPAEKQKKDALYWQEVLKDAELRMDFRLPQVNASISDVTEASEGASAQKVKRDECSRLSFTLEADQTSQLQALVKAEKTTIFVALAAAFNAFLYRYFGQEDITIHYASTMRPKGFEILVGFFVNTLLLRTSISPDVSFKNLVKQVSKQRVEDRKHRYFSYGQLVNELRKTDPELNLSNVGIGQTLFSLHNLSLRGLKLEAMRPDAHEAIADLLLLYDFDEVQRKLFLGFEYRKSLFAESFVLQMQRHFVLLLERMLRDLDAPLSHISLLSEEEAHKILVEWNRTETPYPKDKTLHRLFEEQVERTPDNVAVLWEDQSLTYRELNEKANRLARLIRKSYRQQTGKDIVPDTFIALCMERSIDSVIGTLAILKAGGAYAPIDPSYPKERRQWMLENIDCHVLLTQRHLSHSADILPDARYRVICVDELETTTRHEGSSNLENINESRNLAYVMYTSGSTGNPKGVLVEHQSIVRLVKMTNYIEFGAMDVVAHASNISFDAATMEIWGALLNGGRLVCVPYVTLLDIENFGKLLQTKGINILWLTAALFEQYALKKPQIFKDLKYLLAGGDVLGIRAIQSVLHCIEGRPNHFLNGYGPTENTTFSTTYEIDDVAAASRRIPIGKPIANSTVYVLDKWLRPVPTGVVGELYVGGDGLARGYLNRDDLTRERFIANPFATEEDRKARKNSRLYKTGDLVRYLPDGNIEFIGRADFQVKLRGFRIELGEIEAAITQAGIVPIAQAMVILREDQPNQKYLAAYVTLKKETEGTNLSEPEIKEELRKELRQHLPEYMVPGAFVVLEKFPINPSGKVDRKALPIPDLSLSRRTYIAPRTAVESILARIWADLLRLDKISVQDNFFAMGGDSIISIQAISRAKAEGLELDVRDLFQSPTIEGLAKRVKKNKAIIVEQGLLQGEAELIPIQRWFFEQRFRNPNHFNQSVLFQIPGNLTRELLAELLLHLAKHHDALRFRYRKVEGTIRQEYSSDCLLEIHETDLSKSSAPEKDIATRCQPLQESMDIEKGPIFQAELFQGHPDGQKRLFLVAHHLAIDGVSWRILLEDLETLYYQHLHGTPHRLPAKTSAYRDWGEALLQYKAKAETQWEYWLNVGVGATPIKKDQAGELPNYGQTATSIVQLSAADTKRFLTQVSNAYHTQSDDILLVALLLAIEDWSGAKDLLLHLESHGREGCVEGVDVSRTIGWFTSMYPVHLKLPKEKPERDFYIGEAVKSIKEQLRLVPNKGLGYGILRYGSEDKRAKLLQENDRAEIAFNYLGVMEQSQKSVFSISQIAYGRDVSDANAISALISVNGGIERGQLTLAFTYSQAHYHADTIRKLTDAYQAMLEKVIGHCTNPKHGCYTISDFPLATLLQNYLDRIGKNDEIETIYGLSPLQQGLLFHALYAPTSDQYYTQIHWQYEGKLDIASLKRSWEVLIRRNAVLRTAFEWEGLPEPIQIVYKRAELEWHEEDWTKEQDSAKRFEEYLVKDRRGFDLKKPSLMRCSLIKMEEDRYGLIWGSHHLLTDGWCLSLIFQELNLCYQEYRRGLEPQLPVPEPYENYIRWLRKQNKKKARDFWQKQLKEIESPTILPIVKQGIQLDIHKPIQHLGKYQIDLTDELSQNLQKQAKETGITLSTILQLTWAILLAKYSGAEEVVFGTVISGRPAEVEQVEKMIGLFINTLPVRVRIDHEQPLRDAFNRFQEQFQELNRYGYLSLQEIQGLSKVSTEQGLFYTLFVLENYPVDESLRERLMQGEEVRITSLHLNEKTNYPLTMLVLPGARLGLTLSYDQEAFTEDAMERLGRHYEKLLTDITRNAEARIKELDILLPEERQKLLVEWNRTEGTYPKDKTIHQLFEEQVERTPDNVAVVFEDKQLTYRELNAKANQLAHPLRAKGVKPDSIVSIISDRSLEMIIAIFAILKSGGAYLPIDPKIPEERIKFIIDDSQSRLVLVQNHLIRKLREANPKTVIDLNDPASYGDDISNPEIVNTPSDMVYVIYTSGSTGLPKGVMIEHKSLSNLVTGFRKIIHNHYTGYLKLCLLSPYYFDASGKQIFPGLLHGHTLVFVPEAVRLDGAALVDFYNKNGINISDGTPSHMNLILQSSGREIHFTTLKHFIMGGEELTTHTVEELLNRIRNKELKVTNTYGPTECTVDTNSYTINFDQAKLPARIPIGKPMVNSKCYILGNDNKICPLEVAGELYLGGDGVARGYLNREDLTREKFIANPFATEEERKAGRNLRLYKTGDLARYLPDGNIEYIGRTDFQVKLRGFRIELGEIKVAITKYTHSSGITPIAQALVVLREDQPGQKYLAAYVTLKKEAIEAGLAETVIKEELRKALARHLPEYMVPAAFAVLEKFPLNSNGKIDRKALPRPEFSGSAETYVAPANEIECKIAAIWSRLLGIEKISVLSNFFNSGGHSLLATQLQSQIRSDFQIEFPLKAIFENPTIKKQGKAIEEILQQETSKRLAIRPAIQPLDRSKLGESLPLSFAEQRLWVIAQLDVASPAYNMPVALRLRGKLDLASLEQAFRKIMERHEILRTSFIAREGIPQQVISSEVIFNIPCMDLTKAEPARQEEMVRTYIEEEERRPFDLRIVPLMRAQLLKLDKEDHVIFFKMHHIISDGWSMRVLLQELSFFYNQIEQGLIANLPPLPIQYLDFAIWQREWLQGEVLQRQLEYWQTQLADVPELLTFPADHARPAILSGKGATYIFTLPPTLLQRLKELSQREGTTLFMALFSAFAVLLHRYSNQEDIVIGTPIANRNSLELEKLIGFFANTLALRVKCTDNPSFRTLLNQVKESAQGAYQHQDLPFEQLVDHLHLSRQLNRNPLFQVMFVLRNNRELLFNWHGLEMEEIEIEPAVAKFDLTLFVQEVKAGLKCSMEYASDLFKPETIMRLATHFTHLVESILINPEEQIGKLSLVTEAEKHQMLAEWDRTESPYPKDKTIHRLFEEQVARTPDNVAVVFEDKKLTYRELNERANQLARYLSKNGVGSDCPVVISMPRSFELIVGIIGILKAGGTYVPIDPGYLKQRVVDIVRDIAPQFILTVGSLSASFTGLKIEQRKVLVIDDERFQRKLCEEELTNPAQIVGGKNLAYIIYTSGSTGKPKGVLQIHQTPLTFISGFQERFPLKATDVVLQHTSISFDVSVEEIFHTLSQGAALAITSQTEYFEPEKIMQVMLEKQVTVAHLTPTMLRVLLEQQRIREIPFRYVLVAGEALPQEIMRLFYVYFSQAELHNLYGPTEATYSHSWKCEATWEDIPPIGKLIPGVEGYVLDNMLQPLPIGIVGELYIGGATMARGYTSESLTKERFVSHPFKSGEKLYKTGDLVRYLPDGNVEFIGRADFQVKLRGFRIELGEIEVAIAKYTHSSGITPIAQALVVLREDQPGQKYLAAYVTLKKEAIEAGLAETVIKEELRKALAQHLPEYMVPAAFAVLEKFPLNSNGKIDRKALPRPEFSGSAETYVAPANEIECQLAAIWSRLLGIEKISVHSNFFNLGGNSLLVVQAVSMMNKELGVKLSVAEFFAAPTIAGIVQRIRDGQSALVPVVAFHAEDTHPKLFLIHDGTGISTQKYRLLANHLENQPIYAINNPRFGEETTFASVEEMATCYISLMKNVQLSGPYRLGGFSMGGVIAYEMARQLKREGETVDVVLMMDSHVLANPLSHIEAKEKDEITRSFYSLYNEWLLRKSGLTPEMEIYRSFAREVENNGKILLDYQKQILARPYAGRVILLKARERVHFGFEDEFMKLIAKYPELYQEVKCRDKMDNLSNGWDILIESGLKLEIYSIPGSHYELFAPQNIEELACKTRQALAVLPGNCGVHQKLAT